MRELAEVTYKREIMELHRELATLKARGLEITASYQYQAAAKGI